MHKLQEYQPDTKDPIKRIGRIKRIKNTGIATESPPDGGDLQSSLKFGKVTASENGPEAYVLANEDGH